MARIIINYPDSMDPHFALAFVQGVVKEGRISGSNDRKQFCYATTTLNWAVNKDSKEVTACHQRLFNECPLEDA